jgi:hypothetical protein
MFYGIVKGIQAMHENEFAYDILIQVGWENMFHCPQSLLVGNRTFPQE